MDTFKDSNSFKENLKKFIIDNNIIGTTAGVGIGLATKDVIESLVSDVVFPSFYLLVFKLQISYFIKNISTRLPLDLTKFFKNFITWIIIVVITFIFIQVSFKILLGVDNSKKQEAEIEDSHK